MLPITLRSEPIIVAINEHHLNEVVHVLDAERASERFRKRFIVRKQKAYSGADVGILDVPVMGGSHARIEDTTRDRTSMNEKPTCTLTT